MQSFVRKVFSAAGAPVNSAAMAARVGGLSTALPLHYALSTFRFHNDVRPPAKAIVLPDYLATSASWQLALTHTPVRSRDLMMLLLHPTEVYCVDLRGHNGSPLPTACDAAAKSSVTHDFALQCGLDVVRLQRDTVMSVAALSGVGFGALVAAQAALTAPDAFSSLSLFVQSLSQLCAYDPTSCTTRALLKHMPRTLRTVAEVDEWLQPHVPDATRRALLMSAMERQGEVMYPRFDSALLLREEAFALEPLAKGVVFDKPVNVYLCNDVAAEQGCKASNVNATDVLQRFQVHFPRTCVTTLAGDATGEEQAARMRMAVVPRAQLGAHTLDELTSFLAPGDEILVREALDALGI